jgi:hypothetical protein
LTYVKLKIWTDESIHLSTAPSTPGAAEPRDDSRAGGDVAQRRTANGEHQLTDANRLGTGGLRRFGGAWIDAKYGEIGSRVGSGQRGSKWFTAVGGL